MFVLGTAALLEHPGFGAFVLAVVLTTDAMTRFVARPRRVTLHFATYSLLVMAYLSYVAVQTFTFAVDILALGTPGSAPFSKVGPPVTAPYVLELAFRYLPYCGFMFLYVPAALLCLSDHGARALQLVAILPATVAGASLVQFLAGRSIAELLTLGQYPVFMAVVIPLALAVPGRSRIRGVATILVVVLAVSQLSFAIESDNDLFLLKSDAPQFVDFVGPRTQILRFFLGKMPGDAPLVLDFASASAYWKSDNHSFFNWGQKVELLSPTNFDQRGACVVFNPDQIIRWQASTNEPRQLLSEISAYASTSAIDTIYAGGNVLIYCNSP
jgi:hypothetical protein